ncbi:glycosyltransferase family 2 protein [Hufsiella ginkgonis]|uniref:Glycosyltransferase n=1 Tax=Hufsiella ginkgonis TaxID=2695274 RepID=A0A7K1Y1Z7_9SPHI|nr:glycosyltransferase family 2 protein [Hufsiella ginkgonis]MXV16706.1 glycosyltransferase [Hufsiella ginkgonis]
MTNNIVAAVVTYNRLDLLKEVVHALKSQTHPLREIIIINNSSTDGTRDWLLQQDGITIVDQPNTGISGGVYTGLKKASAMDAEWVWVMDDDSIPTATALEKMVNKFGAIPKPIGFAGPKCLWTDGSVHWMNLPFMTSYVNGIPFNTYDEYGVCLTENGSFASLLINIAVAKEVGLPYEDFFIWGDDQEYTKRITDAGYLGLYCSDSLVLHKTPSNYFADVTADTVKNIWKHKYGFRNEFYMVKKRKGFLFFMPWLAAKVAYTSFKIIKKRKDNRFRFVGALMNSAWKAVVFNPQIDRI